jgi:triacylglycerol lipase
MPRTFTSLLACALLSLGTQATASNNYPIVLVHGFLGFGPEQFTRSGFKYWGGFDDIAEHMRNHQGKHPVFVTSVGSISSSWDRSAELYYQIKGGCVDYGVLHTKRSEHAEERRPAGKCWAADAAHNPENYPLALYPQWDARHPIHLFGHSQGGQTVRSLIQLLEQGSPHGDEGGGDLYQGGKIGWVVSATTISAPHNGTSLRDAIGDFAPFAMNWAALITKMADPADAAHAHFAPDLKLEQFGIKRAPDESGASYLQRALEAPVWNQDNFDSAQHEMGPDGAREFNAWVRTSPHVYYFSIANSATQAGAWCCNDTDRTLAPFQQPQYQYPRKDMAPLTKPYAGEWIIPSLGRRGLGSYTQLSPERVIVDSAWFVNDGVVNTVSMRAPAGQPVRNYEGRAVRGVWNFLDEYKTFDHFDVLGWPHSGAKAYPIYDSVTAILYRL